MTLFLQLLGYIALLLWGLRMVRTGIMRAYGNDLRRWARNAEGRVFSALSIGIFAAALLQSSTATALIAATFSAQGILTVATAFFTVLGADVGSAIAVLVVSQKLTFIAPILIIIGVFGFLSTEVSKYRSLSRALLGLGLILMTLSMISGSAAEIAGEPDLQAFMKLITDKPILMLLLGVGLTYLLHSSLAVVLLASGFVVSSFLMLDAALYLVLGANIGSGLLPVIANWKLKRAGRIPVTANLLIRIMGVVLAFFIVDAIIVESATYMSHNLVPAIFHLLLNLVVATIGVIFAKPLLTLARSIIPEDLPDPTFVEPKYLDEAALSKPVRALANAKREALVASDIAQNMVRDSLPILLDGGESERSKIMAMDDSVDRLFDAIKLYIARIVQKELSEDQSQRAFALLSFSANMEHIGDIVDGGLMDMSAKKESLKIQFSDEGIAEIQKLHEAVCENFELAINTFLSDDGELARQLHSAKAQVRKIERNSVATHIERIGSGQQESIGTSGLHLDVIRDLKRINSHLTAIAYPVLKASGETPKIKWKRKN